MKQSAKEISLEQLATLYPEFAHVSNDIVILDNLENENTVHKSIFGDKPGRINFTLAIYCTRGHIKCEINYMPHMLREGDVVICRYGSVCQFEWKSTDCKFVAFALGMRYSSGINNTNAAIMLAQRLNFSSIDRYDKTAMDEFLFIYKLMKRELGETCDPFRDDALRGYELILTAQAYRYFLRHTADSNNLPTTNSRQEQIFNQFIDEVKAHFREHRNIGFYAQLMSITPKYLSQVVHDVSGHFAKDIINYAVAREAKNMLKSQKFNVKQVAIALHFDSQSNFGKFFRRTVGMTPSEFLELQ